GLSLREYANLQSEKLARMPYGTKVKVIHSEENPTMKVSGIEGGMNEVEFNHKKGFAFNGYLSKYFPPERDITVKGYASELNKLFADVVYKETTGGTVSNPVNTETITLPDAQWHEAFFIAQRLFDFPKEFGFPLSEGKNTEIVFDSKPKKGIWTSQLEVSRKDNVLEKIEYVYSASKFDSTVSIYKDGDAMVISKMETIK
ncbi:MAG: SH3 domain-containing protein, partial [Bacteroidota bacterium]